MINIQTYNNILPGHGIRIDISNPDKPMFVARDVALSLGYKVPQKAVADHCKHPELLKGSNSEHLKIPNRGLTMIPEGDVYRLIVRSKLPAAEEFERKVFDEILPEIRKTGGYIPAKQGESDETIMARALLIAEKKMQLLELDNAEMHQKLDYVTVDAYRALHKGEYWTHGMRTSLGQRATNLCRERGIEVGKENREHYVPGYGWRKTTINVYPTNILDEVVDAMKAKVAP